MSSDYALDNADPQTKRRFGALEELFDERTRAYLTALGVSLGWVCWEVGAGSGSIANWLARTTGPTGSVLATDLDLRWLRDERLPGVSAKVHDVVSDEAPTDAFDLVHARLLLVHLHQRRQVLASLVRSLRPGGAILIEDFDQLFFDAAEPQPISEASVVPLQRALTELLIRRGADLHYAHHLPGLLREAGLSDVAGEGRIIFASGGSPASAMLKANLLQVGDELVRTGLCTSAELNAGLERLDDPSSRIATSMMVSAWGRRAEHTQAGKLVRSSLPR